MTLLESSDDLIQRGETLLDLAWVHSMAGDVATAGEAAGRSSALFEIKQCAVHLEKARALSVALADGGRD